jgi:hypothetical protein
VADNATTEWLKVQQQIHGADEVPNELIDEVAGEDIASAGGAGRLVPALREAFAVPPRIALPGGVVVRLHYPTIRMIKDVLLTVSGATKVDLAERLLLECITVEVNGAVLTGEGARGWFESLPIDEGLDLVDRFGELIDFGALFEKAARVAGKLARTGA